MCTLIDISLRMILHNAFYSIKNIHVWLLQLTSADQIGSSAFPILGNMSTTNATKRSMSWEDELDYLRYWSLCLYWADQYSNGIDFQIISLMSLCTQILTLTRSRNNRTSECLVMGSMVRLMAAFILLSHKSIRFETLSLPERKVKLGFWQVEVGSESIFMPASIP
ncbi:hypothetical protein BDB01DRAFT_900046 [Pilobolus umbonatus]|nr:hypothetical protein BDB01DRAFT_900046 [Pilobolus umbonatus]